jgi:hypothetical protein
VKERERERERLNSILLVKAKLSTAITDNL